MSAPIRLQPLGDSIKKDWDTNIIDFKGYNGSPNLKKSGIKVGFTQDMVDEWIRCRDDPIYFAETYIKIVHVDRGLIPIELYEYQKEVIDVVQGNRKIIVTQSRQSGKALCLDTEIPMSAGGFKRMGDIVVGDSVIGNDGKPAMVTFVSEIHNKPSYRITFSDGSKIKACEDHLWEVNNNQVLSTKELAKNIQTSRFFIPATAPVEYPQIELDFDPYFLGQFVIDVNTPIPDEYLYSSIDDRVALLRGILCSHEYIYRNKGVLEFSLPQENGVIHQIKQLIESLGIVVRIHKKYTRKIDVIHTVISFSEHELLKFSNSLWNIQKKVRYITKVERIDTIPTKCISVNNKNHMFLCGRQYIPTHNTTVATCIILHYILFNQHKTVALLANKGDAALEIMSRIQLAYEYLPKWLQSGIITWNKGSIELENGCKILASATSGSAIRGKSCVSGDTVVTVRNKETGEINDIRIDEISIPFDTIEIYDGEEFRDFHEIRIQKKELFVIQCENGVIKATDDHEFLLESDEWVKVSDLNEHHILKLAGAFKYKKSIGIDDVYDPIHVEVSHQYKSNNFISHNCSLVYIDECVVGDTLITVRDKETGVVSILPIREIHTTDHLLLENTKYEVLTASGFQSFSGSKKTDGKILSMFFSDTSLLECTLSHKILMAGDVFEEAHNICIGDVTSTGLSVIDIKYDQKVESVYDLLDVCNGNAYLTNGVVSHNCAFVEHFDEFYSSVYPTIASGKDTKILFTSCVPRGTLVYTQDGIHTIDEFIQDDKNGFYDVKEYSIYGHGGLRKGDTFYNNGKAETRIFKTAAGHVEASLPHKFFCCTKEGEYKWIETKDIKVGDYMIQVVGQNCFGKEWNISMPAREGRKCKNTFTITEEKKAHIAYFLGQLLSDGYVRAARGYYQVTITSEDNLYPMFENIGVSCNSYDGLHYTTNNKELVGFIKHIGIDINKKAPEKEIPPCILTAPKEIQANFLRGFMDGDGCARINVCGKVNIAVGLSSKKMISQLNAMFCNFGIFSNYYEGCTGPTSKVKVSSNYYRLEIVGSDSVHTYFKDIGFGFSRKQEFAKNLQPHMLPDHLVPYSRKTLRNGNTNIPIPNTGDHYTVKTLLNYKPIVEQNDYYGSEEIKFLYENFVDKNIRFVPVKEITKSENEVYDFSLPHDDSDFFCHSVLYNNILGHQTPNGLNFFYKFWTEAKEERNGFKWVEVAWDKVPGRDDAWKIETLSGMNHDYEQFEVEFNCQFAGSSGTLLSGSSLKALVHQTPIYEWEGFTQYHEPIKEEAYVMLCDVSRGKGLDYSAFQVINVTKMPYVQVATFRSNTITPTDYAHVINKIGTLYNTASVLVENNDIGGQVADMLFDDLDYENLLFTESNGKAGKVLCGGGSKAEPSIRTTTSVKAKGCSVLKLLIEQQQLIINDFNTINELSRFSKKGKSYEAEDGHDDMVMGLVLFAWITTQPYFSNITDVNTLSNLRDNNTQWDECIPFGFIVDGREDDNLVEIDDSGNAWMKTDAWHMNY